MKEIVFYPKVKYNGEAIYEFFPTPEEAEAYAVELGLNADEFTIEAWDVN